MSKQLFQGKTFVSFDLETTGLRPHADRIIEIGAVKYRDGEVVEKYEQLINPGIQLTSMSEAITGITNKELENSPAIKDVIFAFNAFVGDSALIGHNVQFDIDFMKVNGVDLTSNDVFDTYHLASILLPDMPSYSLSSLTTELGIEQSQRHRALYDAIASLDLFKHLIGVTQKISRPVLKSIVRELKKSTWTGQQLFSEVLKNGDVPAKSKIDVAPEAVFVERSNRWKWDRAAVEEIFAHDGALQKELSGFQPRDAQTGFAKKICDVLETGDHLMAEADTGTGKTLGYLVPLALYAMSTGKPAVIATYTLALQDQIKEKELETVQTIVKKVTGQELRVAVLKGRSHYLCKNRFALLLARDKLRPEEARLVAKVLLWLERGVTFERTELSLAHGEDKLWDRICSDRDFCYGPQCSESTGCSIQIARARAQTADIIVTNHALLVSDTSRASKVLPEYGYLVVDEAHHLEDVTTEHYTESLSSETWDDFCGDAKFVVKEFKNESDVSKEVEILENCCKELTSRGLIFFGFVGILTQQLNPDANTAYTVDALIDTAARGHGYWHTVAESGKVISSFLKDAIQALETVAEKHPDHASLLITQAKYTQARQVIEQFLSATENIVSTSMSGDGLVEIYIAPLHIAPILQKNLYAQAESIVLTSATLTVKGTWEYFRSTLGLDESWHEFKTGNIFNYGDQACLIMPKNFPGSYSPKFSAAMIEISEAVVQVLGGRTLILATSYKDVERLFSQLTLRLKSSDIAVLAQKLSGKRNSLITSFKNSSSAVLIGTATFWEGVDIPGDQLSCVIMPKLPFSVPSDPIYIARSRLYENGFMEYALPRAIISFRQGFGRLIRSMTDRGVFMVLDSRIQDKPYGASFLASLPEMPIVIAEREDVAKEVQAFLAHV